MGERMHLLTCSCYKICSLFVTPAKSFFLKVSGSRGDAKAQEGLWGQHGQYQVMIPGFCTGRGPALSCALKYYSWKKNRGASFHSLCPHSPLTLASRLRLLQRASPL